MTTLVPGNALVLVAQVPKAGPRWKQVHFNEAVTTQFFDLKPGRQRYASFQRVDYEGFLGDTTRRPLVFSLANSNSKIEFDFGTVRDYPAEGVPLLAIVELDVSQFRYRAVMPWMPGYEQLLQVNLDNPGIGRGHRRVIVTLDEIEMRWPNARLRNPKERAT